jgi:hypothetical protein
MALPVRFAPGPLRLAAKPKATGSPPVLKTMGMVVFAREVKSQHLLCLDIDDG